MLIESELNILRENLLPFLSPLTQAATAVVDQDVSLYPIFIVHQKQEDIGLGLSLIVGTAQNKHWSVNISTLEELAAKQVVAMEKVEQFKTVYKSNPNSLCCLVWQKGPAQFVFLPKKATS